MAVEVRYHVIRDGQEVAVYLTKKEADEHDKMLDIAFELAEYITRAPKITLDEELLEELAVYLAQNRTEVIRILRAQKLRKNTGKGAPLPGPDSEPPRPPESRPPKAKGRTAGKGKKK